MNLELRLLWAFGSKKTTSCVEPMGTRSLTNLTIAASFLFARPLSSLDLKYNSFLGSSVWLEMFEKEKIRCYKTFQMFPQPCPAPPFLLLIVMAMSLGY